MVNGILSTITCRSIRHDLIVSVRHQRRGGSERSSARPAHSAFAKRDADDGPVKGYHRFRLRALGPCHAS